MFAAVTWLLKLYIGIIVFCAALAILEAVLNFRTGVRKGYIRFLLYLFNWGHQRANRKGFNPENSKRLPNPTASRDLIKPEASQTLFEKLEPDEVPLSPRSMPPGQLLTIADDLMDWCCWGMEVIVTDEVTLSFHAEELPSWNLLTRTDRGYTFVSVRLTLAWLLGAYFRYFWLFPVRLCILVFAFFFISFGILVVGFGLPEGLRKMVAPQITLIGVRILSRVISLSVRSHDIENRPRPGGICVANHTSPIDFLVLGLDNYFAAIGQRFPGFAGVIQDAMLRLAPHIWFDRFERSDREGVKHFLRKHTEANNPPVLLFPEGVCVNNTAVLEFKKGSFEVGATMHPVAIVYDRRLGEPYWFQDYWYQHLFSVMTGWSILCDIYYLPPMRIEEGETSIQFAQRVKTEIAMKGGMVDVQWDGMVRYVPVRSDLIQRVKHLYSERLARFRWDADATVEKADVSSLNSSDSGELAAHEE